MHVGWGWSGQWFSQVQRQVGSPSIYRMRMLKEETVGKTGVGWSLSHRAGALFVQSIALELIHLLGVPIAPRIRRVPREESPQRATDCIHTDPQDLPSVIHLQSITFYENKTEFTGIVHEYKTEFYTTFHKNMAEFTTTLCIYLSVNTRQNSSEHVFCATP